MRSQKGLRAATLAVIASGLLVTACTADTNDTPVFAAPFMEGGSGCVGDCDLDGSWPVQIGDEGRWTSIGDVPLPGGRVALGPGSVGGVVNPTVEQDGLSPEQQAQFVPVVVEGLRTRYDAEDARAQAIAEGIYGGIDRPDVSALYAPPAPKGYRYAEDLSRATVHIYKIEKVSDYPQAQITVGANLPLISMEDGSEAALPFVRTVRVTLMESWILDWSVTSQTSPVSQAVRPADA